MTMPDQPIHAPDEIRQACPRTKQGLQVSFHFEAILWCLDAFWTTPRLVEMVITPDGHTPGR